MHEEHDLYMWKIVDIGHILVCLVCCLTGTVSMVDGFLNFSLILFVPFLNYDHEMNECGVDCHLSVCLSIHLIHDTAWELLDICISEIWYGCFAVGDYLFNYLQLVIWTWNMHELVGVTVLPLNVGSCNGIW